MEIKVSPVHIPLCLDPPAARICGCYGWLTQLQLFYILIAVLGAFALVSLLNYVRTRRRRIIVLAEAERLGLMVPGMDGYVPMRERPALRKLDGWRTPDWWEVLEKEKKHKHQAEEEKGKAKVEHVESVQESHNAGAIPPVPSINISGTDGAEADIARTPVPTISDDADYGARGVLELGSMDELVCWVATSRSGCASCNHNHSS